MRQAAWAFPALLLSRQALAADDLCQIISKFETAPREPGANPAERRWVEFHWGFDHAAFWSWGCRTSGEVIAKETCAWLRDNTNQEFTMLLPQGIMRCYGYKFPKNASYDWDNILGRIVLRSRDGRRIVLDMNYRDLPEGESAVRISLDTLGVDYDLDELPPITSLSVAAPDPKPDAEHPTAPQTDRR